MSDAEPAVEVRGLAKAYNLRRRRVKAGLSIETLSGLGGLLRDVVRPPVETRNGRDTLWALRDITFDVRPGEVLGIIGRNGAGKSTLLKVLARVIAPTAGTVGVRGRVVSILELGLGLDERVTIRENLRIYARLAGLSRAEAQRAEGRILEFAGLAGMEDEILGACPGGSFIRLAFSSLVNLEADVVLADEVLAVGDGAFRKQCESRLARGRSSGECVLFVSHDMRAVRRMCDRVIWIDKGRMRAEGEPGEIVAQYEDELLAPPGDTVPGGDAVEVLAVQLLAPDGAPVGSVEMDGACRLSCTVRVRKPGMAVGAGVELKRGTTTALTACQPWPAPGREPGVHRFAVSLGPEVLNEGSYSAAFCLLVGRAGSFVEPSRIEAPEALAFEVYNTRPDASVWADWSWSRGSALAPRLEWRVHD